MATTRAKIAVKNIGKYRTDQELLESANYKPSYAKSGLIKTTKGWQELMEKHLPNRLLAKEHKDLLAQKKIDYFVFPKRMDDEEIYGHVEAAGLTLIVTRESDKGKMAFYSIPDAQAKQKALDMAYKLKGLYVKEEPPTIPPNQLNIFIFDPKIKKLREEYNKKVFEMLKDE